MFGCLSRLFDHQTLIEIFVNFLPRAVQHLQWLKLIVIVLFSFVFVSRKHGWRTAEVQ